MERLLIEGGHRLRGTVAISGSKNSSLPILAATLLTRETCVISRVPDLSDTNYMLAILQALGAEVERASGKVIVKAEKIHHETPYDLVRKMRASVCTMGPLLGRLKRTRVSLPGGCVIGDRPIDLHLRGMEALGATSTMMGGDIDMDGRGMVGGEVNMRGKQGTTVLGTDNVMMAAVLTPGVTVIEGAAAEPEVVDLANFLIAMGAKIEGAGTGRITIEGVDELGGAEHTVIPDRIEAGTYLVAAAMAGDGVTLLRCEPEHMRSILEAVRRCGYVVEVNGDQIYVGPCEQPISGDIITEPYPGFPTDMQAQMCALFAVTKGVSTVAENVFPQRFMHVAELKRMGADIELDGNVAIIRGVRELGAAPVMASDLRASAALVLAGLCAKGTTEVNRLYHLERGYEHIDDKLMGLGARMRRVRV
jgi:UDP-N-acetylglucosamine 1-carboxyvinyltransferase